MANQQYKTAMREAANAAWDQDWNRAIDAYNQALEAQPQDAQALTGIALSLMELNQYKDALQVYEQVATSVPSDPLPHEKMAEIYVDMGNIEEAATEYLQVAELYYTRRDIKRAVEYWQKAVEYNVNLPKAHMRLALLFEKKGETRQSIVHYIEMARLLQSYGQASKAEEAVRRALNVDATSQLARNAIDDLRQGRSIQPTPQFANSTIPEQTQQPAPQPDPVGGDGPPIDVGTDDEGDKRRSPLDETARDAMGILADMLWSGEIPDRVVGELATAMEYHQVGEPHAAIEHYNEALSGGWDHPTVRFNLGVLYQYDDQHQAAVDILSPLMDEPAYQLAAHLAIGKSQYEMGQIDQAAFNLVEALYMADDLINPQTDNRGYGRLKDSLPKRPHDFKEDLAKSIILYLDDPRWRKRLEDAVGSYAAQGKTSYMTDLLELIMEGGRPVVAAIMQRITQYMEHDMLDLASEEAHYAIEQSPDYLPAHRRLADILVAMGRAPEAAEKITIVAETYLGRGNEEKAADLFADVIDIWPADLDARERVIEMLINQRRTAEAVEQYLDLGDLYQRMADTSAAYETYETALRYAQQQDGESAQTVAILKALADIEAQRFNWQEALKYYERIREIAPDEEETILSLVDLYFQMDDAKQAVSRLDDYIRSGITRGQMDQVIETLEDQVRNHGHIIPIRRRLAQVYERQGRTEDAIAQLNEIGDMQIEANDYENAAKTIRQIIAFDPPDVEQYRQLLQQIE